MEKDTSAWQRPLEELWANEEIVRKYLAVSWVLHACYVAASGRAETGVLDQLAHPVHFRFHRNRKLETFVRLHSAKTKSPE